MAGIKRALGSSKVWTALGAVGLAVAAAFGLPAERVTPVITAIVALATAVILATGYEDGQEKSAGGKQ